MTLDEVTIHDILAILRAKIDACPVQGLRMQLQSLLNQMESCIHGANGG
jgi:hypothetical protein